MIGLRVGLAVGARVGAAVGISGDELGFGGALAGVSQDSTSLKYAPANATEWSTTLGVAGIASGNPSSLYLCQEAAGNLADSIGAVPLVVGSTPSYQQTITGWTRRGVAITATTLQTFSVGAGVGANPAATSVAWLLYVATTVAPGGNRNVVYPSGSATPVGLDHIVTGGKLMIRCAAATTNSLNSYTLATVYPLLLVYNRTAGSVTMYTDQEVLAGTYSAAVTDGTKGIGATQGAGDPSSKFFYMSVFSGGAAEFTTAQARSLLQTLGWTIPW